MGLRHHRWLRGNEASERSTPSPSSSGDPPVPLDYLENRSTPAPAEQIADRSCRQGPDGWTKRPVPAPCGFFRLPNAGLTRKGQTAQALTGMGGNMPKLRDPIWGRPVSTTSDLAVLIALHHSEEKAEASLKRCPAGDAIC